jgi:predicted dehydrogenase
MPEVDLRAVVDPEPAARNRLAETVGCKPAADHRSVVDEIDAAVVAAPTCYHHAIGRELLERGIHLLMEKPLCPAAVQAGDLVELAQAKGAILQVGHVERFNPALKAAAPYIRDPKYIEAVRAGGFTFRSTDIGAVLDLMIHDIDLVLSMVRSPVRRVEALGLSVVGGHEDVANARLHFESGCVASLSASRVSRKPTRQMQIWSAHGYTCIDLASRTTAVVEPSVTLRRRRFQVDGLSADEIAHYKEHFLDEHLPERVLESPPSDAIAAELEDFVQSIRLPRAPQVPGHQGRDAVALAEQILGRIAAHAWDDKTEGPVGPLAIPRPSVIPAPHWHRAPAEAPVERKEAG